MQLQYDQCYVFQQNSTALHHAAGRGSNKVITFLIDHGAEVNAINDVSYHHNITIGVATLNDSNINDYISVIITFNE